MSEQSAQSSFQTIFAFGESTGADAALEANCSTKNPFALKANMAVPLPSGKAASALECRDAGGELVGIWPLHQGRMLKAIAVMRSPNVPLYETASTPTIKAGHEIEVLESMVQKLQQEAGLPTTIFAQSMLAEGPVWEALQKLASRGLIKIDVIETWERSIMQRDAAASAKDYLQTQVSARKRKNLRRKMAKLRRAGSLTLRMTESAKEINQAFDRFCQLEVSGWKGSYGSALQQHPDAQAYFRAVMISMATANRAFIAEVQRNNQSISSGLFLTCGGEITFLRTAYDESLAAQSPGVVLDAMLTKELFDREGFVLLDSSTDGAVSAGSMLWPQRRKMAHVVITCSKASIGSNTLVSAQRARLWLKQKKNKLAGS